MNLISLVLVSLVFLSKAWFFINEGRTVLGIIDIFLLIPGIYYLISNCRTKAKKIHMETRLSLLEKVIVTSIVIVIGTSFFITLNKQSYAWDSVALYDARAKFLLDGYRWRDFKSFGDFDIDLNANYYYSYPPGTSLLHFAIKSISSSIPVSFIYSIVLAIIVYATYKISFIKNRPLILLSTLIVTTSPIIYSLSTIEYTNIFFSGYIMISVYWILRYLQSRDKAFLYIGAAMLVSSSWFRYIEPIWLLVIASAAFTSFVDKKTIKPYILPILLVILDYVVWKYYLTSLGSRIVNLSSSTASNWVDRFFGIFNGTIFYVFRIMLNSWSILVLHLINLGYFYLLLFLRRIKYNVFALYLANFSLLSIAYYFFGVYYVSFNEAWWPAMADSINRSSSFLIPIGVVLSAYMYNSMIEPKSKN